MAKTKDEVCRIAAKYLGLTPVSQQAEGGVFVTIQDEFDLVLADLQAREVVAWGATDTPDECAGALGMYLAQRCAFTTAPSEERMDYLLALGSRPFMDLIAVAGKKWAGVPVSVDRF